MKPLIGLTPTPELLQMKHGTFRRHALSDNYSLAVEAAGGIPVMLPAHIQDINSLLNALDAVIITGGGDIDPARYGQEAHETTDGIDTERDAFEIAVLHAAIKRDMPILGICRGLQIFNIALGGTLVQDVAVLFPSAAEHRQQNLKVHQQETFQTAKLTPGDHPLRSIVAGGDVHINSFHHQSIDILAESLRVMAKTDDGLIEAVYHPGLTHAMAVQWHPEMLAPHQQEAAAIFRSLTEAASTYKAIRISREVTQPV